MGRVVAAVIGGYVVMMAMVFVLSTVAWMAFGADRAFSAGTWDTTVLWIAVSLAFSLLAAVIGGLVCATFARGDRRAIRGLVLLVIVLGIVFAIPVVTRGAATATREGAVTMAQAMQNARQPVWVALLLPLLGAGGVLLGAGMRKQGAVT